MAFYISHRHRVCLGDPVGWSCSFYTWSEGFGSSSLATLPLGFNCGFIPTSTCGSFTGVCFWGCPGGLGFALVKARGGGRAVAWLLRVLAAPGTRGVGGEGSRKYSALEGDGNQYWPVHSSILAWRTPSDREAWQATVYRVAKNQTGLDQPCVHKHKTFFFNLPQWELSMKVV